MDGVAQTAQRLAKHRPAHPVISVYLDLDPERFATAPARAVQIRSLIDEAARDLDREQGLNHADRTALREDLRRIDTYLNSREPPFQGSRALAVFCSSRDGLFETVQLREPATARVLIERTPYIEPLVPAMDEPRWCVALVSRRSARLFTGRLGELRERRRLDDDTHGSTIRVGGRRPTTSAASRRTPTITSGVWRSSCVGDGGPSGSIGSRSGARKRSCRGSRPCWETRSAHGRCQAGLRSMRARLPGSRSGEP